MIISYERWPNGINGGSAIAFFEGRVCKAEFEAVSGFIDNDVRLPDIVCDGSIGKAKTS